MRFTDDRLPPVPPVANPTEVTPKAPLSRAFRVAAGQDAAPVVSWPARDDGAGTPHHGAQPEAGPPEPAAVPYQGEERRMMCRRVRHVEVLLDTRSGLDRRTSESAEDVPPLHLDSEA